MSVLVTGGNDHLGFNLVSALRDAGHEVRASVRSLTDASKTARLQAVAGVETVQAEVGHYDQLLAAMRGIELVFHTAAVYTIVGGDEKQIVASSVQGATNAVRAAAESGVRKVVLTSSTVTLPMRAPGAPAADESDWADDLRIPYFRAKVEGERAAWRTADELGVELVTILPAAIIGPGFERNTPTIDLVESMMRGAMRLGVPPNTYPIVDVRDVVTAHLLAGEHDCEGRFIVCNDHVPTFREIVETMHEIDSRIPLPWMTLPAAIAPLVPWFDRLNAKLLGVPRTVSAEVASTFAARFWNPSNRRIREVLGWRQTIPLEQSLRETMALIRANRGNGVHEADHADGVGAQSPARRTSTPASGQRR